MNLNFSIDFDDLSSLEGLRKLDAVFLEYLASKNQLLHGNLLKYRSEIALEDDWEEDAQKNSLPTCFMELAVCIDDFLTELFSIEEENLTLKVLQKKFDIIYECRRKFVQRVCRENQRQEIEITSFLDVSKSLTNIIGCITETAFAENVIKWLKSPEIFKTQLELAADYASYMVANNSSLPLFNIPRTSNPANLIRSHRIQMISENISLGFDYRDKDLKLENALAQSKYCIYCHNQQKDTCRYGNANNGVSSSGCPLDQKISEMNKLMSEGFNIGALAVIVLDNPLVAATGHRICNDCMKSCIFQKQDPVNIPLIESVILDNVLNLPYGVEIYLLLTKWNPLNIKSTLPKELSNYNVLVVGTGPAGFSLAHYLLNEGHNVVTIDGLKIEPLDFDIKNPIKDYKTIKVTLSERVPKGFGGVGEYGITNRWDKNNLTLVRLILERRSNHNFKMFGGIRLDSNMTIDQAFDFGFDHIALCIGAGKPSYINSKSYFVKGVKSATDFLMNLQQVGAFLKASNNKLLLRMPVIVIGCGLTAIDSAVEAMCYYPIQVEKILSSYEQNQLQLENLQAEEKIIIQEFINHAKLLRMAKSAADKIAIIQQLGGVRICYRGEIKNSPAYKRNHEEIEHAKAIGVKFLEHLSPLETEIDDYGHVCSIEFSNNLDKKTITLPAKSVLIAIGTSMVDFLNKSTNKISHFGDCDPQYSGSVVKALASSKNGYKKISNELLKSPPQLGVNFASFGKILDEKLIAKVHQVILISPEMIELVIHSPLSAENYRPGNIFRLQNFANKPDNFMKPLPLNPYLVDKENGLIHFVIKQVGNSSKLCTKLKIGEEVSLMGPVGAATKILKIPHVTLIGYDVRNLALLPIAQEFKKQGSQVKFLAVYKKISDRVYKEKIESVADKVFWMTESELHKSLDPFGNSSIANMLGTSFLENNRLPEKFSYDEQVRDRELYIVYAPEGLLTKLKDYFHHLPFDNQVICAIPSLMQCMMKGMCGQCVQKTSDAKGYVFACDSSEYELKYFEPKIL